MFNEMFTYLLYVWTRDYDTTTSLGGNEPPQKK